MSKPSKLRILKVDAGVKTWRLIGEKYIKCRGIFRTQSNIHDEAFLGKQSTAKSCLDHSCNIAPSQVFDRAVNAPPGQQNRKVRLGKMSEINTTDKL